MSERGETNIVTADFRYEMMIICRMGLECEEGGIKKCRRCEKYVKKKVSE